MSVLDRKTQHAVLSATAMALRSGRPLVDVFEIFDKFKTAGRQSMWQRCVSKLRNGQDFVSEIEESFSDDVLIFLRAAAEFGCLKEGFEAAGDHVKATLVAG